MSNSSTRCRSQPVVRSTKANPTAEPIGTTVALLVISLTILVSISPIPFVTRNSGTAPTSSTMRTSKPSATITVTTTRSTTAMATEVEEIDEDGAAVELGDVRASA